MRHFGGNGRARDGGNRSQQNRCLLTLSCDGNIQQILHRFEICFRIADTHVVLVVTDRIDPEVSFIERDAAVRRGHDVSHHVFLVQTQFRRLLPVDGDHEFGVVQSLQDARIDNSIDFGNLLFDLGRNVVCDFQFFADHADSNRIRFAFVERRANHPARIEPEFKL